MYCEGQVFYGSVFKGQLIIEYFSLSFNTPKNLQTFALASKIVWMKKKQKNFILLNCIKLVFLGFYLFFWPIFRVFLGARAEIWKKNRCFFGAFEDQNFFSEINRPLGTTCWITELYCFGIQRIPKRMFIST